MNYGNILIGPLQEQTDVPIHRDSFLLSKLRFIIDNLRAIRLGFYNFSPRNSVNIIFRTMNVIFNKERDVEEGVELTEYGAFEMEEPSVHGEGNITTNQASNVVLTEARVEDSVITTPLSRMWSDYVSTDVVGNYNIITDRWMKLKDFEWTTQSGKHSQLFQLKLPFDAVYNAPLVPCDMPNLLPFRIHRYVRCDMEVKIQINSNKFQIGQLQAAWFYQPECDSFFDLRENVFNGSQTHHVLISASASNEASLFIPFKYHLPMVSTKARSDISFPLNIGTLKVRVLNPLSVTQNGPAKCNGVVFIRFMNCEFTGMVDGAMDIPSAFYQMDRIVDLGANILKGYLSANEDNPPSRRVANYIVPTATHSWSMGTDITEPLQMLRLSNTGRTMHPDVVENEQLVASVVSKFGLVNTFDWTQSDESGKILWKCSAAPILEMSCYNAILSKDKHILTSYYIPPVGVVSSLFQYWRGSLEFRFDVIATQFHTGRLLVGYVPGATSSSKITLSQLYASPHMIFTLQENQTFTYQIPYIANKPFWSRNYVGNHKASEVIPPSYLYVAVLNPLIPMESVVAKIQINVYMRGGPDFEVSIPVQPCFGLAFNRNVLYTDTEIVKALTGYWPYYAGTWHSFLSSEYLIFRWGTASDEVAQFQNNYLKKMILDARRAATDPMKTYTSYYYSFENSAEAPKYQDASGRVQIANIGLILYGLTNSYTIFVPISSQNLVEAAAKDHYMHYNATGEYEWIRQYAKDHYMHYNATGEYEWIRQYAIKITSTSNNDYISGNPNLIVSEVNSKFYMSESENSFDECASIEGERESAENVLISGSTLTSTNSGRFLFGEQFHDLMDLCRRYQLYGAFNVDLSKTRTVGQAVGVFPVVPQGLALDIGTTSAIVEIPNRCRDGHIPLVLSGFRYGRGSIRFRIVGPSGTIQAWVQHRPDRKLVTPTITVPSKSDRAQSLFNHSYAYYVQDLNINSIMEFEVPFYQNSAFCLLQGPKFLRTDEAYYYTLGDISIGFVYTKNDLPDIASSLVTIYYSLADDFQMSTFQGFPPMVLLDDIATPEMMNWTTNLTNKLKGKIVDSVKTEVSAVVQEASKGATNAALEKIAELKESMEAQGLTDVVNTSIFRCIMTNIAHCTITTNLKHIVTAIISVFIEMGLVAYEQTTVLLGKIMNLLNWVKVDNESGNELTRPDIVEKAEEAVAEMETPSQEAAVGIITILWSGMCSLLSITTKCPKDVQSLSSFLTKDMTNVMRSSNIFFLFLKNVFSVMGEMKQYLLGVVSPKFKLSQELEQRQPELVGWCQEVLKLEDPEYRKNYQYTQFYKQRVDMAYLKGSIFYRNILQLEHKEFSHQITKLYDKIRDLRDASVKTGSDSYIRKQCFTVWQCGEAGVGKSTISTQLIMKLLKHRNITTSVPPIYVHSTESDFWDTCVGNPAMVVDDLFNIQTGTIFEKHLILLFMLYSPVVLSPPKADLLDKGMTYNPEIFWINSNYKFFEFDRIHKKAIHRRRDVLFESKVNPNKKAGCLHCDKNIPLVDCDPELLSDNHHLIFYVYEDVCNSADDAPYKIMEFPEFLVFLKDKYDKVMDKNERMYEQRIAESMELFLQEESEADCMDDYIERVQKRHDANLRQIREASLYHELKTCLGNSYSIAKENLSKYLTTNLWDKKASPQMDVWKTCMEEYNHKQADECAINCLSTSQERILKSKNMFECYSEFYKRTFWSTEFSCYHYELIPLDRSDRMFLYQLIKISSMGPTPEVSLPELFKFMAIVTCTEPNIHIYNVKLFIKRLYSYNKAWMGVYFKEVDFDRNSRVLKDHVCMCKHVLLDNDPELCFIEDGVLYNNKRKPVDKLCAGPCDCGKQFGFNDKEEKSCIWDNHAFKYMWYKRFIDTHPHVVPSRGIFKNIHIRSLPDALKPRNAVAIPDESKFVQWFKDIKQIALEWVYKTYVIFGKIFKFISSLPWPLITCLLTGFVCSGSLVYSSYSMVHDNASRIARKQLKHGGAWESHSYTNLQNVNMSEIPRHAVSVVEGSIPQVDVAIKLVMNNFFQITCIFNERKLSCHGVVLKSRKLLILRHYIEEYEAIKANNPTFYGKFPHRKFVDNIGVQFNLFDCKITNYGIKDEFGHAMSNYMLLELPLCFPESKCLTQFIATTKDHQRVYGDCVLVQNSGKVSENIKAVRETNKLYVKSTATTSSVTLYDKYTYRMHAKGMCGSILLCNNLERPIIGMHVAGVEFGNERGISELLCLETFEEVIKKEEVYHSVVIPELTDAEFSKININSMIYPLGCTDAKYTVYQSGDTSIVPSKIHGVFPVDTAPNPLSKNDPRLPKGSSPLEDGCANMGKPPLDFETKLLDNAVFDLQHKLLSVVKPVRDKVGVLDLETAICGNPDIPHFESLEWKSSPGYPLRFEKKGSNVSGKKYLFDLEEYDRGYKLKGLDPALQKLLTIDEACRKRGIKPFTVFIDCLKDTTLPIEKCSIPGKTRIFSISPVQFTIQFKQYFLDFMASYQKARTNAEHGIGIDVNSLEWTHVANLLQSKGERIVCGDYKNFGPGLMKKAAQRAFDIIFAWYELHGDGKNNNIRKIFASEILDCPHLVTNLFYTTPCGIPSGSPITTPLNDICNGLYLRCAWELITNMGFDKMNEHCVILHYGDDVCINVTDEISEVFNTVSLRDAFEKYNIVFTDISKDGSIIPYRTLATCQFLKCGFLPHPFRSGVYTANLDKKSIQGCANWILKRNDPDVATIQNCETVLELAHGWGESYYNECLNKMLKECMNVNLKFRALKWSAIDERRYSRLSS
ncbi:hypothetical protein [Hubei picorna-like virus 26]|uniref:hypothetical protein n=1 Tax=Hubei picorna-like virus 26 TaxID=1923106 RepID=UPI00090BA9BD|nr:hypothetical protein [Hubei picorna-like virus 26]APG77410.1 hypothetical protein [Hubei picorna-like virus 26]